MCLMPDKSRLANLAQLMLPVLSITRGVNPVEEFVILHGLQAGFPFWPEV